ncbi:hypothetical protein QW131_13825 [Roseibium salinum]|nr:hypothetical protein [Roseibium salinum]
MNLRLLPLLGISASALLALKLLGLTLGPDSARFPINGAVAQEKASDSGEGAEASGETTAEVTPPPPAADEDEAEHPVLPDSLEIGGSAAERAVLESLGKTPRKPSGAGGAAGPAREAAAGHRGTHPETGRRTEGTGRADRCRHCGKSRSGTRTKSPAW